MPFFIFFLLLCASAANLPHPRSRRLSSCQQCLHYLPWEQIPAGLSFFHTCLICQHDTVVEPFLFFPLSQDVLRLNFHPAATTYRVPASLDLFFILFFFDASGTPGRRWLILWVSGRALPLKSARVDAIWQTVLVCPMTDPPLRTPAGVPWHRLQSEGQAGPAGRHRGVPGWGHRPATRRVGPWD